MADKPLKSLTFPGLSDTYTISENVFWATYSTTTSAEIEAAVAAGKVVLCEDDNHIYRLQECNSTSHYAYFCCWEDGAAKFDLICDSDTWDASTSTIGTYKKPSGGIPKTDLAGAVQASLNKADTALQSVPSTYRTAAAQDVIDEGKADKVIEVTISTAGEVTQALDAGKIYHFTGALTALTVTATDPTTGKYQFDFISGSTVPTLTVPASWVMPDNFLVEPSARYSLTVENGYCSLKKWSDSHSPFIYLDSTAGDFTMNTSGLTSDSKVYANVGSEVIAVSIGAKLKNQLANNTWLKICDVSANAKALIGSTYVESYISVGGGKVAQCAFNTWETASEIKFKNNTGAALAANTQLAGTIFIMRTL